MKKKSLVGWVLLMCILLCGHEAKSEDYFESIMETVESIRKNSLKTGFLAGRSERYKDWDVDMFVSYYQREYDKLKEIK